MEDSYVSVVMSKADWALVLEFFSNMLYPEDFNSKGEAKSTVHRRIIEKLNEVAG